MKSKCIFACGLIFATLFGCKSNDIDIFLQEDKLEDKERLQDIEKLVLMHMSESPNNKLKQILRTANSITILKNEGDKEVKYHVMLRKYVSTAQILYSFDLDCCGVAYDGKNIWITNRHYMLLNMQLIQLILIFQWKNMKRDYANMD